LVINVTFLQGNVRGLLPVFVDVCVCGCWGGECMGLSPGGLEDGVFLTVFVY
jgi:hypothetical protein